MKIETAGHIAGNLLTAAAAIAAVVMVSIRIVQFVQARESPVAQRVADWRWAGAAGERLGPRDAKVTIVEFADFQCPFCAAAEPELKSIESAFPSEVAVVFRHFPLAAHKFAGPAAMASECAARQGRFEQYHDVLLASQSLVGKSSWQAFATASGVPDLATFNSCLGDPTVGLPISIDRQAGLRLGVDGTPTFLINDLKLDGYPGPGQIARMVRTELATPSR